MSLMPFDGFKQFSGILREFERLFSSLPVSFGDFGRLQQSQIVIDEMDNEVIAKCYIPGLNRMEDVRIEIVDDNILMISGTNNQINEVIGKNMYQKQWFAGRFQRTVQLPCAVSYNGVSAKYKDDLLEITMPKQKYNSYDIKRLKV